MSKQNTACLFFIHPVAQLYTSCVLCATARPPSPPLFLVLFNIFAYLPKKEQTEYSMHKVTCIYNITAG